MKGSVVITGLDETLKALDTEVVRIERLTRAGLRAAGLKVQAASQLQVPRRLGDLFRSAYTRFTPEDPNIVEVGYAAAYALFVHEMRMVHAGEPRPEPYAGVLWGPHGNPKYLENPFNAMTQEIIDTIAAYVDGKS